MKKPIINRDRALEKTLVSHDSNTDLPRETIRTFASGATRDTETEKLDFDGFLSPAAIECFARYMHFHRQMPDGSRRDSDNWQKGFPGTVLVKSLWRHFFSFWRWTRFANHGQANGSLAHGFEHPLIDLCGIMFNVQAYMRQMIEEDPNAVHEMIRLMELDRAQRLRQKEI